MWYSYKVDHKYRIGYATSKDGKKWTRDDQKGLGPGKEDWEND